VNGRIGVLIPTRDRPQHFERAARSVYKTGLKADVLAYIDDDQEKDYPDTLAGVKRLVGPRIGPVASANVLVEKFPDYSVYGLITDDTTMVCRDWDEWVLAAMDSMAGRIVVVSPRHNLGEHVDMPFVSREWIDTVGWYACPDFYHFCWPVLLGLMGQLTCLIYPPEQAFSVHHEGLPHTNLQALFEDKMGFFDYVALKLPPIIDKLRAAQQLPV